MSWQDVQALRKSARFREAIELAQELLSHGYDRKVRTQLDWSWYGEIKRLVQKLIVELQASQALNTSDVGNLVNALRGYARQPPIRPDNPLSNIVREVAKVAAHLPQFPGFIRWVGEDGLASEDWNYQERDGTVYKPVAIAVARGLAKWVKAHREADRSDVDMAYAWLCRAQSVAKDDDALWVDWDLALMLRRLGDYKLAAETLSTVLKAKSKEFWVWAEAARVYADEQPDLAKACFCRALGCSANDKFAVNVHRELAELLAEQHEYAQASFEVARAIEIRQNEGWSIDPPLQRLIDSSWYDPSADGIVRPHEYYSQFSQDALVLCFDHVEAKAATFLGMLIPHTPKDPPSGWKLRPLPRFALTDNSGRSLSIVGPGLRNLKFQAGDPVTIILGRRHEDSRETVVQVAARPDGSSWDCTEVGAGVVVRESAGEKSAKIYVCRDSEEVSIDESWLGASRPRLGQGVKFRTAENPKNGRKDVFAVEPGPLPDQDVKLVQGRLRRNAKGFAFIEDAFVPPHILGTVPEDINDVAALIVYGKHPTKDEYSWRAVKLSRVS